MKSYFKKFLSLRFIQSLHFELESIHDKQKDCNEVIFEIDKYIDRQLKKVPYNLTDKYVGTLSEAASKREKI
jgi:hypothetical protein